MSCLDQASEVFIPSIVLGELFFGAAKSGRPSENLARKYGSLKERLREKGKPLPENDIWIAATAICHNLVLVTRDSHFREVDELVTAAW